MRKLLFGFFLFPVSLVLQAQTGNPDSIKQLLKKEKQDTSRVIDLVNLSFEYIESKPDTMMILALQALDLSRRIGYVKGEAMSLNRIGNANNIFGNYAKSMEAYLQALQINERINNLDGQQRNLNNIGTNYLAQEDYRQALNYLFQAKSLGEQLGNKQSLSSTYTNIAAAYDSLKVFDSATLFSIQAKAIAEKIEYSRAIGSALHELGSIYCQTGEMALALEHYRSSIPYHKQAKNDLRLSETFLDMAMVFQMLAIDSAFFYARQSLLLAQEKGFIKEVRNAARFLSYHYRKVNADSAFFYQDISRAANDFLFSRQKQMQFQALSFDEKMRQQQIASAEFKVAGKRRHNLQYAAIALGVISFLILFFALSHSIVVNERWVRFFGVLALLLVFELINLFIHPYLAHATGDSPFLMLMALVCIAALLIPAHHRLEHWIKHRLVEKNKTIRLAAAKKIIAKLEG